MTLSFFLISLTIWIIFKLKEISKKERWYLNEIQQKNEKSFPAHSKIFEELFTLSHVDRIPIDFLIKVYFLLHQSETIAADDKNIWSWNHRSFISYFHIFLLLFIPFLYFDQRGSQPNSMEKSSF